MYSLNQQHHKIIIVDGYNTDDMTDWITENIDGVWNMRTLEWWREGNNLLYRFEFSFADIQDAALFRLKF